MSINGRLREMYLDYLNNYISVETFAERNNIETEEAMQLIDMGKRYHNDYAQLGFEIRGSDK
mgnify:CR=1 FL=1